LKVIFAERNIKHGEFANRVGISQGALSLLVNGRSLPTLQVAYRIAEELELNVMEIWVK
jgi:putative transcriptional regulator